MLAILRDLQIVLAAPHHHFVAVIHEVLDDLAQVHDLRHTIDQRQHDRAEGRLHLRVLVQLVQHDLRDRIALQLHHDAHPVPVALVPQVADPIHFPLTRQLGDLLDQARLVHHERDLGDDDPLAPLHFFDLRPRPHHDPTTTRLVGISDPLLPVHYPCRGEVGPLDLLHQVGDRRLRVVDQVLRRRHDLAQVVRRDVGRHAHRDARRAVDQQIGKLRR